MNPSIIANLPFTMGNAIGTAYRRILENARKELSVCDEGDRVYDIKINGEWKSVGVLFEDLFSIILPEALIGDSRYGIQDGVHYASVDFWFMPGQILRVHEPNNPVFAHEREMQLEIELPTDGEPIITVGYSAAGHPRVKMYPEDLAMLRETLLANYKLALS
jgi:hypothetical protein